VLVKVLGIRGLSPEEEVEGCSGKEFWEKEKF